MIDTVIAFVRENVIGAILIFGFCAILVGWVFDYLTGAHQEEDDPFAAPPPDDPDDGGE